MILCGIMKGKYNTITMKVKNIVFHVLLFFGLLIYFAFSFPELKSFINIGIRWPTDYPMDYIAGKQLLSGKTVYPSNFMEMYRNLALTRGIAIKTHYKFTNHHPPFVAMLLLPLSLLSFENAVVLYSLITILCMFFINYLLLKSEDISLLYFPFICLFTFAWLPFHSNLLHGQISILVALFVTIGWFYYKRENEIMSGIFIALATMLKFYPGLLIVFFLINKRYKALLSSIISSIIIMSLALIVTKHDLFTLYFNIIPEHVKFFETDLVNFSINSFFSKLFLPIKPYNNTTVLTIVVSPFLKNIFLYLTIASLIFYVVLNIKEYNNDLGFSLFVILSLLLSPICFPHYLILLLLPFIILIKELIKRNDKLEVIIFLISLFLISVDDHSVYFQKAIYIAHTYLLGNSMSFIDTLTFYSAQFYGMVLLLFLNFRMIKKTAPASVESGV